MENFLFALNTVLPFLLYIAFGYGVRMSGLADEDFMKRLNKVIFQAFFPILMFNNLYSIPEGMTLNLRLVAAARHYQRAAFAGGSACCGSASGKGK